MLLDFGPLLGQRDFERAWGVVMHMRVCNAELALEHMIDLIGGTCSPPDDIVAALLTTSGRAQLARLLVPGTKWGAAYK